MGAKKSLKYTTVKITKDMAAEINEIIKKYPIWRSVSEFVSEATRTQILHVKEVLKEGAGE
ncbi:MAG: hypothetical protein QXT26_06030 [Thermoproteota archaeon]